jgi:hypothetical protein
MAEGIHMMYRLFMVSVVAFVVFGAGAFVYNYHIDVRDVEARILAREMVECLAPEGVLDARGVLGDSMEGCELVDSERMYLGIEVFDLSEKSLGKGSVGDSGALWIADMFGKAGDATRNVALGNVAKDIDSFAQYEPGYYRVDYSVVVLTDAGRMNGKIDMEVLINYEN